MLKIESILSPINRGIANYLQISISKLLIDIIELLLFNILGWIAIQKTLCISNTRLLISEQFQYEGVKNSVVSGTVLNFICYAASPLVIIIYTFLRFITIGYKGAIAKMYFWIKTLYLALLASRFSFYAIKGLILKPRPDFVSRNNGNSVSNTTNCDSIENNPDSFNKIQGDKYSGKIYMNILNDVIRKPNDTLLDDIRSFPSGHACYSFATAAVMTSWWIAENSATFSIGFTVLLPSIYIPIAFAISKSRYLDYKHDLYDITSGAFLGLLIALIVLLQSRTRAALLSADKLTIK